jgi:YD repeat-containing protein
MPNDCQDSLVLDKEGSFSLVLSEDSDFLIIKEDDFSVIEQTQTEFLLQEGLSDVFLIVSEIGVKGDKGDVAFTPKSPVFSYDTEGKLTGIVYSDNSTKTFFYDSEGTLIKIESTLDSINYRKTFNYTNGVLTSILDETL